MVKGYQFKCDYGDGCGMKEYKSHEHLGADYVLATDYAALAKDRDEWKRRCEAIVAMAAPGTKPCNCIDEHGPDENCEHCEDRDHYGDSCEWYGQYAAHTRILAIAEGRDNG